MQTAYRIFKTLSPFDRTVSHKALQKSFSTRCNSFEKSKVTTQVSYGLAKESNTL